MQTLQQLDILSRIIADISAHRNPENFQITVFNEMWGSTAMGYDGIGCDAMTNGLVAVFYDQAEDVAYVYLGRVELAYVVKDTSDKFWKDVKEYSLLPQYATSELKKYGQVTITRGGVYPNA